MYEKKLITKGWLHAPFFFSLIFKTIGPWEINGLSIIDSNVISNGTLGNASTPFSPYQAIRLGASRQLQHMLLLLFGYISGLNGHRIIANPKSWIRCSATGSNQYAFGLVRPKVLRNFLTRINSRCFHHILDHLLQKD